MKVVLVGSDLLIASRIAAAADAATVPFLRVEEPADVPVIEAGDLVLVDWGDRKADWADTLQMLASTSAGRRVRLFGPHTDLDAHAAAAAAGLGPMLARSNLVAGIHALIRGER